MCALQWSSCAWAPSSLVERIRRSSYWLPWTWGWSRMVTCLYHTTLCCMPCHIRWLCSLCPITSINNIGQSNRMFSFIIKVSSKWVKFFFLSVQSGHSIPSADEQHAAPSRLQLCSDCYHGVRPEFLRSVSPTSNQPRDPNCCGCHSGKRNKHATGPH